MKCISSTSKKFTKIPKFPQISKHFHKYEKSQRFIKFQKFDHVWLNKTFLTHRSSVLSPNLLTSNASLNSVFNTTGLRAANIISDSSYPSSFVVFLSSSVKSRTLLLKDFSCTNIDITYNKQLKKYKIVKELVIPAWHEIYLHCQNLARIF